MSLKNKVVLVTGGSSGIGAAIALKFAEEGAKVVIVGRNKDKLHNVSELITKVGNKPLIIVADVTNDEDSRRIITDTLKEFEKLDVLVNNAGVGTRVDITEENAMEIHDHTMATNFRSVVYLTHLASKHIIETKGTIINISSVAGQLVMRNGFAYAASKAALEHFSRSIALDLAPNGVRVNTISPGPTKTDFVQNMGYSNEMETAAWEQAAQLTALKRFSEPVEVAELALFLASDKAVGITGSTYQVDNGLLLGKF